MIPLQKKRRWLRMNAVSAPFYAVKMRFTEPG